MGTESFIRKAAHRLMRRKQPLLEPLDCTDASLGVSGMAKTAISPLRKPQGKELGKWHGSVSRVRRFLGRWSPKSLGPESHSGDARNIAVDLEDSRDGEASSRLLPTSSPRVSNLPTPQPTQTGQSLHLSLDGDPVARRREMKLAALEQAQIQEELSEAARLRGGCVPCCKGTVTLTSPQNDAPGLLIQEREPTRLTQAARSPWGKPRSRAQSHATPARPRTESHVSRETNTLAGAQTRRGPMVIEEDGLLASERPFQPDIRSRTASQIDSRPGGKSQNELSLSSGKPSVAVQLSATPPSTSERSPQLPVT